MPLTSSGFSRAVGSQKQWLLTSSGPLQVAPYKQWRVRRDSRPGRSCLPALAHLPACRHFPACRPVPTSQAPLPDAASPKAPEPSLAAGATLLGSAALNCEFFSQRPHPWRPAGRSGEGPCFFLWFRSCWSERPWPGGREPAGRGLPGRRAPPFGSRLPSACGRRAGAAGGPREAGSPGGQGQGRKQLGRRCGHRARDDEEANLTRGHPQVKLAGT